MNPTNDPIVVMQTNKGTLKIRLYFKDVPNTCGNFMELISRGFYNGLTFHRHEPGFCLQGGCPQGDGYGGSEKKIKLETRPHLKHDTAGILAMARTDDPDSATCQFYFTLGPAPFLDGEYAVFGKIVEGMEVLNQLTVGDKMTNVSIMEPAKA